MTLLYNFGIYIFKTGLIIASFFDSKAKKLLKGQHFAIQQIHEYKHNAKKSIWLHAASLGEFEQGIPVLEKLKNTFTGYRIVVTFFSPSGFETKKHHPIADFITYLPLDTNKNAEQLITQINPGIALFVKYEYWFHFFKNLNNRNIPIYIISARFHSQQHFFKFYGGFFRKILKMVNFFFIQDEQSGKLLKSLGFENYFVTGDTRFDRVIANVTNAKNISGIKEFKKDSKLLIAGSTWEAEEQLILKFLLKNKNSLKVIIAPHSIDPKRINFLINNFQKEGIKISKYTEIDNINYTECMVLVIDNIGLLSSLYQYGDYAFIGGAFGAGLHNILEAVCFGIPVIFGPKYHKFQEAIDLIKLHGAFSVSNFSDFEKTLLELLNNKEKCSAAGNSAKNYIDTNKGATEIILRHLIKEQY